MFDKGVVMPFNVNNVDITVSANFVFGVVICTITGLCDEHIDDDIQVRVMCLNFWPLIG